MTVGTAVAVLVGVLALTTVLGLLLRHRTGRARSAGTGASTRQDADGLALDTDYGTAATFVQFSTPTCARCPATRRQLDAVADQHEGVRRIEIDLAEHPELARRFDVMQTPTVLLLDADRTIRTRFGGPPRPPELAAALDAVLTTGSTDTTRGTDTSGTTGNQESR
ncbi:thioredoxin family protein [Curtobacterium flaccumfaciens]|uniref:Thioredoxin family protein n=1 Tax=Curtobacterium poinsettiae TaxID=159612 RepID=A0A9Q9P521_9MICO|nr:thioredoxin family protein [Curtobacterium flaccumfaciens]UXN24529.1 thioredoxin family protein [Curtobacterium flaccumfaciens]UYC79365.1 thioredoxin family protein [Curtobacterium flaccumfaciens pv. poinsettiae]